MCGLLTSTRLIQSSSSMPIDLSVRVRTLSPRMSSELKVDPGYESKSPMATPLIIACTTVIIEQI